MGQQNGTRTAASFKSQVSILLVVVLGLPVLQTCKNRGFLHRSNATVVTNHEKRVYVRC